MAIYTRKSPAPVRKRYRAYKRFLRIDFFYRCVFCGIHENDHGGFWHFHVEHIKPKAIHRFRHLKTDYTNLMYCCDKCNILKGTLWPSDDPVKDNKGWPDPCQTDYEHHYQLVWNGSKLQLVTHTGLGGWISGTLLLNNSLRTDALEKIARRNDLDEQAIRLLEDNVVVLTTRQQLSPDHRTAQQIAANQRMIADLKAELAQRYQPEKFRALKR